MIPADVVIWRFPYPRTFVLLIRGPYRTRTHTPQKEDHVNVNFREASRVNIYFSREQLLVFL